MVKTYLRLLNSNLGWFFIALNFSTKFWETFIKHCCLRMFTPRHVSTHMMWRPSCLIVAELGNFEIDQSCRSWKPVTLQFHHPGKRPALTVLTMFPYCEDEKTDKRYSSLIIQRRATFNCLEDEIILSFKFPAWAGYSSVWIIISDKTCLRAETIGF